MRILVTGSTGLIGRTLLQHLSLQGHQTLPLRYRGEVKTDELAWNYHRNYFPSSETLAEVDAVFHLAGENIASGRWTKRKKQRIKDSRVLGSSFLAEKLSRLTPVPKVLISASAIGYYGDRGSVEVDENSGPGSGFLAEVCRGWEQAFELLSPSTRVVNVRFGMVLSSRGGALKMMLPSFKAGLGAMLGNGEQYISWISLHDAIAALSFALSNSAVSGAVNGCSANPIKNREFSKVLAETLKRPCALRAPQSLLKMVLGEMADDVLLSSTRALPRKLLECGFEFQHPELHDALKWALSEEVSISRDSL